MDALYIFVLENAICKWDPWVSPPRGPMGPTGSQRARQLHQRRPTMRWLVPLGLGSWLTSWKVGAVTEMDWWQAAGAGLEISQGSENGGCLW